MNVYLGWRNRIAYLAGLLSLSVAASSSWATSASGSDLDPASKIVIVDLAPTDHRPLPLALGQVLQHSRELERNHPNDLSYSWFDERLEVVVVDSTSARGTHLALDTVTKGNLAGVAVRTRSVRYSVADFERVRIDLAGNARRFLRNHGVIWLVEPDYAHNRLILSIERMDVQLLDDLAARYGTEMIAVRVDRDRPNARPHIGGRQNDSSPFYGGAAISVPSGTCSSAFAWKISSSQFAMLTAGHCISNGGSVYSGDYMGSVTSGNHENWSAGFGTVPLSGQSTHRGDIALITLAAYNRTHSAIYRGPWNSVGSTSLVAEMWSRSPWYGDKYCVGGKTTGEICNWSVDRVGVDFFYASGETVRHAYTGYKSGTCMTFGDSGGSVFTVRSDGAIAAKGIHSGGGPGCVEVFTDIWDAYYGFPGVLHTW